METRKKMKRWGASYQLGVMLSIIISAYGLSGKFVQADIELENVAIGKSYDFNRPVENIDAGTYKCLTDTVTNKAWISWSGTEKIIITLDLGQLCKVANVRLDFKPARDIAGYISRDNVNYEKLLKTAKVGDEILIRGAGLTEGQFLKIELAPQEGISRCSEIEVLGYPVAEGIKSDVGLSLWMAARQKIEDNNSTIPKEVTWDISKSYKEETPTRKRICLNGSWRCQSVWTEEKMPPLSNWEKGRVLPFITVKEGEQKKKFWSQREFMVPAEFKNRLIFLKVDYIGYYGKIFLNGNFIGEGYVNRENRIDITNLIRWNEPNELTILASSDIKSQKVFSRGNFVYSGGYTWTMVGDVWLESFPAQGFIKHTQIVTSTRRQELKLLLDVVGKGQYTISGEIYDKNGKVKELPEKINQAAGDKIEYVYPWKDAKYWSVESPNLYWLSLVLKDAQGNVIDRTYRQRFGFREFWIEGGDFYLNGIKTRLFLDASPFGGLSIHSTEDWVKLVFGQLKEIGFNSVRYPAPVYYEEWILKIADEIGLLVILNAAEMVYTPGFETDASKGLDLWQKWNRSEKLQQETRDDMKELIARVGNHPSLVMWLMTFNSLDHPWTMNPYKIDGSYTPCLEEGKSSGGCMFATKEKVDVSLKLDSILNEVDRSKRPIFHHSCGNVGQAITVNAYQCFGIPKQEWEDWPMLWSRKKPKPLINTEDGLPIPCAWYGKADWVNQEPLHVEFAAMYFGDKSYRKTSPELINALNTWKTTNWQPMYRWLSQYSPQVMDIGCMFARDRHRAWRTYGVSGIGLHAIPNVAYEGWEGSLKKPEPYLDLTLPGPKPADIQDELGFKNKKPTRIFYGLKDSFQKVVVYVGGPGDNFTAKDHCYFSEENVSKQIIIINDSEKEITGKLECKLLKSGDTARIISSKTINVKAGETGKEPLTFNSPSVENREEFNLEVILTIGEENYKDIFKLTVFPKEKAKCAARVLLLDDVGITEKVLKNAGIKFDKLENVRNIDGYGVLIIGREYGKNGGIKEARQIDFKKVFGKGILVIVFEQKRAPGGPLHIDHNDDSFTGLKLREGSYRYTFIRDRSHPILKGLESSDLIDWRGESDMMEAFPASDPITETNYPERFWKLGNKGIVSTYAIEKPSKGSFRVISDAGFDLSDAVLLEWMEGKSRIIFCQMDVSTRYGKDPVATRIINNIFEYSQGSRRQVREAVYVGGDRGTNLLETVGLRYRKLDNSEDLAGSNLLIIGDLTESQIAAYGGKIRNFISNGGIAVFLPKDAVEGYSSTICPPGMSFQKQKVYTAEIDSMNEEFLRGLGIGDFFLKNFYEVIIPASLPQGSVSSKPEVISKAPYGKGACIFLSLDPGKFEKQYPYEKLIRNWNTIFANLGVDSKSSMLERLEVYLKRVPTIELAGEWKFKTDPPDKGLEQGWNKTEYNDNDWQLLKVPGYWEDQGITNVNPYWTTSHTNCGGCAPTWYYNGYAWYRKHVFIPESYRGVSVSLQIGSIDDYDWTYLNGTLIGKMGQENPNAYRTRREYDIPASAIKYGQENVIAIRIYDLHGGGGFRDFPVRIQQVIPSSQPIYVEKYFGFNPYSYARW